MAITFGRKKYKRHYILYTVITTILLCVVFVTMVRVLYVSAQENAYEDLHVQTKQIKDDIRLQLLSDRENLSTMANFAANLYSEEERYDIMFESFKPIGLIENIGILNADNTFVTKAGTMNVEGSLSFEEEVTKGAYMSSRVIDITTRGKSIVRSAVPIEVEGEVVGILYGVIQLDKIGEKYQQKAADINAQLFVYDKNTGDLIIDNVHKELGNISFLKEREYNDGYSYEEMAANDKGFTSFMSAYKDENAHLHYSTIEDIGWMIALARYDSQVFAQVNELTQTMLVVCLLFVAIIALYILIILKNEREINSVTNWASDIRRILLETANNDEYISDALKDVALLVKAQTAAFFNADGEDFNYMSPSYKGEKFSQEEKQFFMKELFRYASEFHNIKGNAVNVLRIKPNKHLQKTNPDFYELLKKYQISNVAFSATINNTNNITILAVINAKHQNQACMLGEKVSACFSMALYNKNYLNKTKLVATTDSLTGVMNRVAYKSDLVLFDEEQPTDFSCIYIDVNELHLVNNKYGHAAGDEMLLYIANTLKEVFYGHRVYRMGGDEFLVFCKNIDQESVKKGIESLAKLLQPRNYHVAIGVSFRTRNTDTEEMVKEAEVRMYEAKASYYQNKEQLAAAKALTKEYVQVKTGILEIDTMISILKEKYNGIYRVSLDTDKARRILMPAYLNYNENEEHFSILFSRYVEDSVNPDFHRAIMSFLNYEAIKHQLAEGTVPKCTYKKNNGETVALSVYKLDDSDTDVSNTLWFFSKE